MDVFVYGTLTEPARADALLDDWQFVGEATLAGLHRVDGVYPTLGPGGHARGRLLRTAEVDRLDEYEGVDRGVYVRVSVPVRADRARARVSDELIAVYVGDPDRLDAPTTWPGEGSFADRVRRYVDENAVAVRPTADRQD